MRVPKDCSASRVLHNAKATGYWSETAIRCRAFLPKSRACTLQGVRTLAIPSELVAILKTHLAIRGLTENDTDTYLFARPHGAPLHYSN
jgi:hypothetical protein